MSDHAHISQSLFIIANIVLIKLTLASIPVILGLSLVKLVFTRNAELLFSLILHNMMCKSVAKDINCEV